MQHRSRDARIARMSASFDRLSVVVAELEKRLDELETLLPEVKKLKAYQSSGKWLQDYEADERGEIPAEVNRSVLSQDGLYDLLADLDALSARFPEQK